MEKEELTTIEKTSFIDPGTLLKNSWVVYKENWARYIFLSVLPYLSVVVYALIAVFFVIAGVLLSSSHNYNALILLISIGVILTIIYFTVTFSIGSVALISLVHSRGRLSIKESLQKGWHVLWQYWWVTFLGSLLISGGFFLFLIPGIIFSIWFIFAVYIFVIDGTKGMNAILKSREYVRGHWWGVLGRILLVSILVYLVTYVPQVIFHLLDADALGSLIQVVISFAIAPFTVIFTVLMYDDLKKSRPDVATMNHTGKWLYIGFSVLGFVVFLAILFFGAWIGWGFFQEYQMHQSIPKQEIEGLPNFT